MFTAALFTIAKTCKLPKGPSTDELDKDNMVYVHRVILLSYKDEQNNSICSNMDGPRAYRTK